MSKTAFPVSDEEFDRISNTAWDIYNRKLKVVLEPDRNGQVVAIHIDTEDFEVARNSPDARFTLRRRHPEGPISTIDIGPVDPFDPLSPRMIGNQLMAGQQRK
jgi:hypothetical protein